MISAKEAIKKLEEGNKKYLTENTGSGDISPAARLRTCANGQQPYAIVIACSDSRVIPESIFSADRRHLPHRRRACGISKRVKQTGKKISASEQKSVETLIRCVYINR